LCGRGEVGDCGSRKEEWRGAEERRKRRLRGRKLLQLDRDAAVVEADGRRQKCVLGLGLTLRIMISLKPQLLDTLLPITKRRFAVAGIERWWVVS